MKTHKTTKPLLIVSYGVGVDSTAMIAEFYLRDIRPDIILFSDTGGEKPETYKYIHTMNEWLKSVNFPRITIVKYKPKTAPYHTLEDKCLHNETLPSIAFSNAHHSCAIVFKRDVMVKYLKQNEEVKEAIAQGRQIVKAIGYDDSKADKRRSKKAKIGTDKIKAQIDERLIQCKKPLASQWETAYCEFWYPLQEWKMERHHLANIIKSVGLPVPVKSACFFCPASKPSEVVELKNEHPELYQRALKIEQTAREGRHGLTSNKGLPISKNWAWSDLEGCDHPDQAANYLKILCGAVDKDTYRP